MLVRCTRKNLLVISLNIVEIHFLALYNISFLTLQLCNQVSNAEDHLLVNSIFEKNVDLRLSVPSYLRTPALYMKGYYKKLICRA